MFHAVKTKSKALLIILAAMLALSACGAPAADANAASGDAPTAESAAAGAEGGSDGAFPIEILTRFHTAEAPTEDNKAIRYIEELGNFDLNITWVANAAYDDKMNVTIASGEYPEVMLITGNAKPRTIEVEAIRAGMFWNVGDYLQDYDWLKELNPTATQNASIDGELWGMYRSRPLTRTGWIYRSDWLENLSLAEPKNPQELHDILKAFVEQDPDGNGVADTGGLAMEKRLDPVISALAPYYGLPHWWSTEGDVLEPVWFMPEYLEILRLLRSWYEEGLINQDFPATEEAVRDESMSNKNGWAFTSIDTGKTILVSLQAANPDGNFACGVNFADSPSDKIWGRTGWDGKYYVSKQAVPEEADFLRIMEFFNLMHSPEVNNLLTYGIEGEHYTKDGDNSITVSDDQKTLFLKEIEIVEQIGFRFTKNNFTVSNSPSYVAQYEDYFNNKGDLAIPDPTSTFNSETYNEKGLDLDQFRTDIATKFITGAIDEAGWEEGLQQWREMGGDQYIADYQAEYDAQK